MSLEGIWKSLQKLSRQ